jgi:hypothetical protein
MAFDVELLGFAGAAGGKIRPDPPAGVPAWFPDFLEAVAGLHVERAREFVSAPAERFLEFRQRAASFGSKDYYEVWAKRYLAVGHAPSGRE